MSEEKLSIHHENHATIPVFGYSLLRERLLPTILGKETADILYWAGKELGRNYPLPSLEEIIYFFANAGWGTLTVVKDAKNEVQMELSNIPNWSEATEPSLQLEAGFLSQQIGSIKETAAEAFLQPKKRAQKYRITIKW